MARGRKKSKSNTNTNQAKRSTFEPAKIISKPGEENPTSSPKRSSDMIPAHEAKKADVVPVNGTGLVAPRGGMFGGQYNTIMDELKNLQTDRNEIGAEMLATVKDENEALKEMVAIRKAAAARTKILVDEERRAVFGEGSSEN